MAHWKPLSGHVTRSAPRGAAMRKLTIIALLAAAATYFVKKQREREFDESIWEEPQRA
jgi:hypothetical protein